MSTALRVTTTDGSPPAHLREAWSRGDWAHGEWFASPDWIEPWLAAFAGDRTVRLCFVESDGVLHGVVPTISPRDTSGWCGPTVETPDNPHVRRTGVLARGDVAPVISAVLAALSREISPFRFDFRQLEVDGRDDLAVRQVARDAGFGIITTEETHSAVVDLRQGWNAYLDTRSAKLRRDRRRRIRKLEQIGGFATTTVRDADAFEDAWSRLLDVEARSWKEERGTSIGQDSGADDFYREVARRQAACAALRLMLLEHHGEPVAHVLGVVRDGTFYLLKNSYDAARRDLALGALLVWQAMEGAAAEGCHTFDFLGDLTTFKAQFATASPRYVSHRLFRRSDLPCRGVSLAEHHLKPAARSMGLDRAVRWMRRRR